MKVYVVFKGPNNYYLYEDDHGSERTFKKKPIALFFDKDSAFEYVYYMNGKNNSFRYRKQRQWTDEIDMPDKYFDWTNEILNG